MAELEKTNPETGSGKAEPVRGFEEAGYQRSGEEQHDVHPCSHEQAEPKDSVVIFVGNVSLIGEGGGESAFLKRVCHSHKDGKHADHSVVGIVQQAGKNNTEEKIQQLLNAVAESSPEESSGCFLFQ